MQRGGLIPVPQDENQVSWAPRFTKEMGLISWEMTAMEIHNKIRAMNPWPIAVTVFREEKLHVLRSLPRESLGLSSASPGTLLQTIGNGISIQCGQGTVLDILEVQRPSKGRVSGREFASGARLQAGEVLFR
jgi:methionyl-tRNA formyltransferase